MDLRILARLKLFIRPSSAYLIRHRIQTFLMIVGIIIGVAVAVAMNLANASSAKALELSTVALAGKTTHQLCPTRRVERRSLKQFDQIRS